jgi:hypothetical protein
VSLRQHEPIVVRILRLTRVVAHFGEEQRGDNLRADAQEVG